MIRESRQGLPFTLSPEYVAAQRAYMRYHNMNPIFGISSKWVVMKIGISVCMSSWVESILILVNSPLNVFREARAADEAH